MSVEHPKLFKKKKTEGRVAPGHKAWAGNTKKKKPGINPVELERIFFHTLGQEKAKPLAQVWEQRGSGKRPH